MIDWMNSLENAINLSSSSSVISGNRVTTTTSGPYEAGVEHNQQVATGGASSPSSLSINSRDNSIGAIGGSGSLNLQRDEASLGSFHSNYNIMVSEQQQQNILIKNNNPTSQYDTSASPFGSSSRLQLQQTNNLTSMNNNNNNNINNGDVSQSLCVSQDAFEEYDLFLCAMQVLSKVADNRSPEENAWVIAMHDYCKKLDEIMQTATIGGSSISNENLRLSYSNQQQGNSPIWKPELSMAMGTYVLFKAEEDRTEEEKEFMFEMEEEFLKDIEYQHQNFMSQNFNTLDVSNNGGGGGGGGGDGTLLTLSSLISASSSPTVTATGISEALQCDIALEAQRLTNIFNASYPVLDDDHQLCYYQKNLKNNQSDPILMPAKKTTISASSLITSVSHYDDDSAAITTIEGDKEKVTSYPTKLTKEEELFCRKLKQKTRDLIEIERSHGLVPLHSLLSGTLIFPKYNEELRIDEMEFKLQINNINDAHS